MRSVLTKVNFNKNELQNPAIHNLPGAPATPVKGQMYFNLGDNTLYWYDGTQWVTSRGGMTFGPSTSETAFGTAKSDGVAITAARADHTHGNPTHGNADHAGVTLSALAAPVGDLSMGGYKITNVGPPTSGTDAANKNYVDNLAAGLVWKAPVRVASTGNQALSGLTAIDGVTPIAGDRILLKNQTNPAENGIWVAAAGAWTRATDADTSTELVDAAVFVSEGTSNQDTAWVQTANAPITVGTTALPWVQFVGGGTVVGGAGMTQSGNTLNVVPANGSIVVAADDIQVGYPGTGGNNGSAVTAARSDHAHGGTYPPVGRQILTTAPLTGGGDLSADRTLAITPFSGTVPGSVPASPGGVLNFLRADGTWALGPSEVSISPTDPISLEPGTELWFDTDDPSGGVVTPAFDGTPQPVGITGAAGTAENWARGDHVHAASAYTPFNGNPSAVNAAVAAAGVSTSWARGDHVHSMQPGLLGRRLNDNGQMSVKQRTAATMVGGGFLADRWYVVDSGVGVASLNHIAASGFTPVPAGRPKPGYMMYLQMTTAEAAGSLAAADQMFWQHGIEGQNLQHLNWGTAGAQPLTYSFDVFSTIATTYVVELYHAETTPRSISVLLPVPAGFSTQSVTFPGDTVTPITNDTTGRLYVIVWIETGSQFTSGVLQTSWGTSVNANRCPGLSNTIGATVGNTFALTNAQLEIGTVATPYEVRPYGEELRACQRCFRQTPTGVTYGECSIWGYGATGGALMQSFPFPVTMRAAPTVAMGGAWVFSNCSTITFMATAMGVTYYVNPTATGNVNAHTNGVGYMTYSAEI